MPAFVCVGIDCSDNHHDIEAVGPGNDIVLRLRVANNLAGFNQIEAALRDAFGCAPTRFALENPSLLIARFFLARGAAVYAVNPRSVAQMRCALASSGRKDDRLDARALRMLLEHRCEDDLSPIRPSSEEGSLLAGLVRQRVDLVEEKNRVANQLTAVLKGFYPRPLELFSSIEQPLTLAFLERFPCPSQLRAATRDAWDGLFTGVRYPRPGKVDTLWERSREPQVDIPPADEVLGLAQVKRLVRMLRLLLEELSEIEAEIKVLFEKLPEARVFSSLPGAADVLGPALFAVFGDNKQRWSEWKDVARLSGTVPVTRSSGNYSAVGMRRHCDHRARRTLHLFAACSRRNCKWAREFYADQRRKGKSHGTALRNLATKWLRILFRMWKDGVPYEEGIYLRKLEERKAPIGTLTTTTT